MRTVPSDDNLAKAIVSILNEFKWTYISAVYDDTYYGIGGYYNFENEAKGSSICLAVKEQLKVNQPNYSEVLHSLMAVQRARGESTKRNASAVLPDPSACLLRNFPKP